MPHHALQVTDLVLQSSDVVVVCFDATRQASLDAVRGHWYARIQALNTGVPVIMACCKADRLGDEREVNLLREVRGARSFLNTQVGSDGSSADPISPKRSCLDFQMGYVLEIHLV